VKENIKHSWDFCPFFILKKLNKQRTTLPLMEAIPAIDQNPNSLNIQLL
jgi:hypothetical protein